MYEYCSNLKIILEFGHVNYLEICIQFPGYLYNFLLVFHRISSSELGTTNSGAGKVDWNSANQ